MVVAFHELEAPADLATQLRVLADELAAVEAARAEEHGERDKLHSREVAFDITTHTHDSHTDARSLSLAPTRSRAHGAARAQG